MKSEYNQKIQNVKDTAKGVGKDIESKVDSFNWGKKKDKGTDSSNNSESTITDTSNPTKDTTSDKSKSVANTGNGSSGRNADNANENGKVVVSSGYMKGHGDTFDVQKNGTDYGMLYDGGKVYIVRYNPNSSSNGAVFDKEEAQQFYDDYTSNETDPDKLRKFKNMYNKWLSDNQ